MNRLATSSEPRIDNRGCAVCKVAAIAINSPPRATPVLSAIIGQCSKYAATMDDAPKTARIIRALYTCLVLRSIRLGNW